MSDTSKYSINLCIKIIYVVPRSCKDHGFEEVSWSPITKKRRIYVPPPLDKLEEKMTCLFPGLLSFTNDADREWLTLNGSWHLSHKTVGRPRRVVCTKHATVSVREETQGGSHLCRGTKGIWELSTPHFISLASGILATVLPLNDGQQFERERKLKLAKAKIRYGH